MLKRIAILFQNKHRAIQDEVALKSKIDEIVNSFIKEEIIKEAKMDYRLSHSVNNGIIKIEINNKLIAQEIALRVSSIEEKLRKEGALFKKVLI